LASWLREVSLVPSYVALPEPLQVRSMIPLLMPSLFDAQDYGVSGPQDLLAPDASVVKFAGDMKFIEGPGWLPKTRSSWS